uniref:cardiolipin synthase (CMP-forming) n=1 Tax=Plectus sambesii TaxID=2011161 RepID=A0A914XDW6_9BILA
MLTTAASQFLRRASAIAARSDVLLVQFAVGRGTYRAACRSLLTTPSGAAVSARFACCRLNSASERRTFLRTPTIASSFLQCRPLAFTASIGNNSRENRTEKIERFQQNMTKVRQQLKDQTDAMKENVMTVPNALCVARIVLSPVIGYLVVNGQYTVALGLFSFAGLTDLLDGFIARRFVSQQSRLGSILDPIADKLLVSILFLSLTYVNLIPLALTGLIILRDVCLLAAGFIMRYKTLEPPKTIVRYFDPSISMMRIKPTGISKINTGLQLILVAASLAAPVFDFVGHPLLQGLCWLTAGTTLYSGLNYIWVKNTMETVKRHEAENTKKE